MSEMLKVSDLHVYYGSIHAVKGVSFEVHEGEVVTLIGANGAGKSTILNTVSGLLHPRSGSILFHEKNLHGVPAHKLVGMGLAQVPEGRHRLARRIDVAGHAAQASKPALSWASSSSRPMKTARDQRRSFSPQGCCRSPSRIMCTAWKAKRRVSLA